MAKVLVVGEQADGKLNDAVAKVVKCAQAIGEVDVAIFAKGGEGVAAEAAKISGVNKVLLVENDVNEHALAASLAPQIVALVAEYTHILGSSSTVGRDVMPRVAALLDVAQVTDIMSVEGEYTFRRPVYAGNAIVKVDAPNDKKLVGTVRVASFSAADQGGSAAVETVSVEADIPTHTRFVNTETSGGDRPDLQSAKVVVSGGRGVGSEENFAIIYSLADKLGAGVGASRAAVDSGFAPSDLQVGQTGKIIAPDLYFAVGISGAIQHLAGIKDAGTIVAINKDADAPIFEVADIGLVGDLFTVLPELEGALG